MTTRYRHREITREGVPLPTPSSAPQEATDTADTRKPPLMMRSAWAPTCIVSGVWVNSPISWLGRSRQITVPASMMPPHRHSTVW